MDAIKTFDVDIDLTDVYTLYDYGRGEYIRRNLGSEWDYDALAARACDAHIQDNETIAARVKHIDSALVKGRRFDKDLNDNEDSKKEKHGSQYFGDFNIMQQLQRLPKRVLPVYKPGDMVKGHLILETTDKIDGKELNLTFKGRAQVRIRIYNEHGYYDSYGEESYINERMVCWEKSDSEPDNVSDSTSLVSMENKITIPPGIHQFPFEYVIPSDARGSVPNLINSDCDFGQITYRFKGCIDLGKPFSKRNIVTVRKIWVDKSFDIAQNPENLKPFSAEETHRTGFIVSTGKIVLKATLPRKAFTRGEKIPVTLDIENACSTTIKALTCRVHLFGIRRKGTGKFEPCKSMDVKSSKVVMGSIPGDHVERMVLQVPLDFTESCVDNNLIPAGTLDDCTLLDCRYEIIIKAKRTGPRRDVELKIPIIIGTENSQHKISTKN